jgi:hypothetical protein
MVKDPDATPKQAEDFIYCMTFHAEIRQDHSLRITKVSHPTLRSCFPEQGPITIATGEALAQWCANPAKPAAAVTADEAIPKNLDARKQLKIKLWALAQQYIKETSGTDIRETGGTVSEIEGALLAQKFISIPFKDLSLAEMGIAIDKLEVALSEITP